MKTRSRILVAGTGNIFLGDDAFGVETVRTLTDSSLPTEVSVMDFGVRRYDLAQAMADDSQRKVIVVDTSGRGDPPGTLHLIEPDVGHLSEEVSVFNGFTLNSAAALLMARELNKDAVRPGNVFVVGCEPATLETEDAPELSPPVRSAVSAAVEMIHSLIDRLLNVEASAM
jgi:hydrogenase maturation protease